MSDESWKVNHDGWADRKERPDDPDWWYDVRIVDHDGGRTDWYGMFFFGNGRRQWRKKSPEAIAKIERERGEKWASKEMAFTLLPVFSKEVMAPCRKCGHDAFRVRAVLRDTFGEPPYNEHEYLSVSCRRCKATRHEKPLDWENPV
mgnify:CR=1 FL=1